MAHGALLPSSPRERRSDLAIAIVVTAVAVAFDVIDEGDPAVLFDLGPVLTPLLLVLMGATLVVRRTRPDITGWVTGLGISLYYLTGNGSPAAMLLWLFAQYAVAAFGEDRREGIGVLLVSTAIMSGTIVAGSAPIEDLLPGWGLNAFAFGVAWGLGDATRARRLLAEELRARADQVDAMRVLEQEQLVADERRRIARELHDVVSHTVSVVVVQASAARRVAARDPEAVVRALESIESTGREALAELRRMLGLLRDEDGDGGGLAPAPDLASITTLVEQLRSADLPVRLDMDADLAVPPGIALTVHRTVQEGLTNVLRHAEDVNDVTVRVAHGDEGLVVEVTDDGRPAGFTGGSGTGLLGLEERAALLGGTVEAGPRGGRGYRLRLVLPVGRTAGAA